jgi:hypothetical protein
MRRGPGAFLGGCPVRLSTAIIRAKKQVGVCPSRRPASYRSRAPSKPVVILSEVAASIFLGLCIPGRAATQSKNLSFFIPMLNEADVSPPRHPE